MRFEPPRLAVTTGVGRIGKATVGTGALNEARAAGREEAFAEVEQLIEQHRRGRLEAEQASRVFNQAVQQLRGHDVETLEEVKRQVIALAVALAESIIGREAESFDGVVLEAVQRAISLAPDRGVLVLRVNPQDRDTVAELAQTVQRPDEVTVLADPTVGRGGCVAQIGGLLVDASVEAAIARIRSAFEI
jgi:flagellar assembly protein FliH